MKDLISVIMPVYNVAAYLPACLDSVLSQDHRELEVIVIDDGSTDGAGAICDGYAEKDSRVKVIHQKNGGAAAAKNAGLRMASGEYLSFVDSDDLLEPGSYTYMLGLLKEYDADAVECAYRDLYRDRMEDQIFFPGRHVLEGKDYLVRFTTSWTCALLWNKLYKRSLFDGVFFEEGHKIDDEYFTYQGFLNARKVVCDDRVVYQYRRRASSVMLSPAAAAQRTMDRIDAISKRREVVNARYPELREVFDTEYVNALVYMSEYPDNSEESIAALKQKLWGYLSTPGNTLPPKRFWRGIAALLLTPAGRLVEKYWKPSEQTGMDIYFQ